MMDVFVEEGVHVPKVKGHNIILYAPSDITVKSKFSEIDACVALRLDGISFTFACRNLVEASVELECLNVASVPDGWNDIRFRVRTTHGGTNTIKKGDRLAALSITLVPHLKRRYNRGRGPWNHSPPRQQRHKSRSPKRTRSPSPKKRRSPSPAVTGWPHLVDCPPGCDHRSGCDQSL